MKRQHGYLCFNKEYIHTPGVQPISICFALFIYHFIDVQQLFCVVFMYQVGFEFNEVPKVLSLLTFVCYIACRYSRSTEEFFLIERSIFIWKLLFLTKNHLSFETSILIEKTIFVKQGFLLLKLLFSFECFFSLMIFFSHNK